MSKTLHQKINEFTKLNTNSIREQELIEMTANFIIELLNLNTEKKMQWTKERLREESLKYTNRTQWAKSNRTSYDKARKCNMLDELCSHMDDPRRKLTKEFIRSDALKYKTRTEWKHKSQSSYITAWRNGWVDEFTKHMKVNEN